MTLRPSRSLTQRTPDELRAQLRNERAELRHATRTLLDETNLRLAAPASVHLDHVYLQLVLEYAAAVTEHVQLEAFYERATLLRPEVPTSDESSSSLPPTRDTDRPPPAGRPCETCFGSGAFFISADGLERQTCPACLGSGEVLP